MCRVPGTALKISWAIPEFSCHRAGAIISIYGGENLKIGEAKDRPKVVQLATGSTRIPTQAFNHHNILKEEWRAED